MKITAKKIYFAVFFLILFGNILSLFIFSDYLNVSGFSIFPAWNMLVTIFEVAIMFDLRHLSYSDMFWIMPYFRFIAYKKADVKDPESPKYQNQVLFCLFIYLITIPFYIPLIFFSSVDTTLISIPLPMVPYFICMARFFFLFWNEQRKEKLEDERLLKEQERNEALGKWK